MTLYFGWELLLLFLATICFHVEMKRTIFSIYLPTTVDTERLFKPNEHVFLLLFNKLNHIRHINSILLL